MAVSGRYVGPGGSAVRQDGGCYQLLRTSGISAGGQGRRAYVICSTVILELQIRRIHRIYIVEMNQ